MFMVHINDVFRLKSKISDMGTGALANTRKEGIFNIDSRCLSLAAVISDLKRNCRGPFLML